MLRILKKEIFSFPLIKFYKIICTKKRIEGSVCLAYMCRRRYGECDACGFCDDEKAFAETVSRSNNTRCRVYKVIDSKGCHNRSENER